MICIFLGPTPANLEAGDVQTAIHSQVAPCEHSPEIQERQDGCFRLERRPETLDEIHQRIGQEIKTAPQVVADLLARNVGGLDATPQMVTTGRETKVAGTRKVVVSPDLLKDNGKPVRLADFPEGFSFGNGVTTNSMVRLRDGSVRVISWAAFPDASEATVTAKADTLRQLVEG
jgi:hypothetical protein